MQKKIKIFDVCGEYFMCQDDGELVLPKIIDILNENLNVTLDLKKVKAIASLAFSAIYSPLIKIYSKETLEKRIKWINNKSGNNAQKLATRSIDCHTELNRIQKREDDRDAELRSQREKDPKTWLTKDEFAYLEKNFDDLADSSHLRFLVRSALEMAKDAQSLLEEVKSYDRWKKEEGYRFWQNRTLRDIIVKYNLPEEEEDCGY